MTTMVAWMAYALVISGLLTGAALLAERAARAAARPARWLWAAALVGSLVLPLLAWAWPEDAVLSSATSPTLRLQPIVLEASTNTSTMGVDQLIALGWLAASLAIAGLLGTAALRLRRARAGWQEAQLDGELVLISEDVGPAVIGFRRGRIVMPAWVLRIRSDLRRLMLLHEREHLRAGDPRLLLVGLGALVCAPWNPCVWLQFLRLRLAIEIDCDARVLRQSQDARGYGALLLEVGLHRSSAGALAVAFGEPRRFLEERIRMIPRALGRRRLMRASALACSAAVVLLLAVCARDPLSSRDPLERAGTHEVQLEQGYAKVKEPHFTPFTVGPELVNRADVVAALETNYPPLLRAAGIGGQVLVWFFIDETGTVRKTAINRSSGHDALDQAALSVAQTMRFEPAKNRDEEVAVWVAIPLVFSADQEKVEGQPRIRARQDGGAAAPPARGAGMQALRGPSTTGAAPEPPSAAEGPSFTPFTQAPELLDPARVAQLLEEHYPPLLREAGIGGEVLVWFLIDSQGDIEDARVDESSGSAELDEAALRVARAMRFSPARHEGQPVPVWVAMPIVFQTR